MGTATVSLIFPKPIWIICLTGFESVWKVTEAPRYPKGFIWTVVLNVGMIIMAWVTRYFWRREKSRKHTSS